MDDNPISIIINPLLVIIMDYLSIKISLMFGSTIQMPLSTTCSVTQTLTTTLIMSHTVSLNLQVSAIGKT